MKKIILFSIVLETMLFHSSLFAQHNSNTPEDSVAGSKRQLLTVDISGFPFNHTHSGSWQPTQTLRIGYGYGLIYPFKLKVYVEYCKFDFDIHDGLSNQDYSKGQRLDYIFYPAIVVFDILEFAIGGYYTIQDEVIHHSMFSPQLTIDPIVKESGVYTHLGLGGTIHILGPLNCSLGIFWRNVLIEGSIYFGGRAGLGFDL